MDVVLYTLWVLVCASSVPADQCSKSTARAFRAAAGGTVESVCSPTGDAEGRAAPLRPDWSREYATTYCERRVQR